MLIHARSSESDGDVDEGEKHDAEVEDVPPLVEVARQPISGNLGG